MGGTQSKADDKVFYNQSPIEFSQDVVNHLTNASASPTPSPARQSTLDAHIRDKIQAELEHLRQDEEAVREQIEQALEKENLDSELNAAGSGEHAEEAGGVKHSVALAGDLEEVRRKVERFSTRRELVDLPEVKKDGEAVVACYKSHPSTPLDCWQEVNKFKMSVGKAEQEYFKSLRSA